MGKEMAITRAMFPKFRTDLDDALKALGDKYGVTMSLGTIRYSDTEFSGKLMAVSKEATSGVEADDGNLKWKAAFLKNARVYGLTPEDLGKDIVLSGITYKIVGARPKAGQPIVLKRSNGSFIASYAEPVRSALGK
jgi:hypothetical protein